MKSVKSKIIYIWLVSHHVSHLIQNTFMQAQNHVRVLPATSENEITGFPGPRMMRTTWATH